MGAGHYARVGLEVTDGLVDRDATIDTIAADASAILDSPATPITTTVSDNMRRMFEGFRPG